MRLCSYVVVHDTGFAPNPFWGFCTLAACTPNHQGLRLKPGDWIVGHSALDRGQRLIHAMRVSELLDFDDYYRDPRFLEKRPRGDKWPEVAGDNLYHRAEDGRWIQDRNASHGPGSIDKDTRKPRVFISDDFYYFGENAVDIPAEFAPLIRDRQGCRCEYPEDVAAGFVSWLRDSYALGIHGQPRDRRSYAARQPRNESPTCDERNRGCDPPKPDASSCHDVC